MSFWVAYFVSLVIVWVMLELFLLVMWFEKSQFVRENLQRMIMTCDNAWESTGGHIFINSGDNAVIISRSWFVLNDLRTLGSFGVLQTIMARNLHKRARELLNLREALE